MDRFRKCPYDLSLSNLKNQDNIGQISFREDLPSISGSKYSKGDIKLFDGYREHYLNAVRTMKFIISGTKIGFDTSLCDDTIQKIEEEERSQKEFNDLYVNSAIRCYVDLACNSMASRRLGLLKNGIIGRSSDDIITAFYIPEDMDWIKVTLSSKTIRIHSIYTSKEGNCNIPDDDLELILERSKIIPVDKGQYSLEDILKRSQNPYIRHDNCGEETIDIDGIRYKRVVLFHPGLPIVSFFWFTITYTTSDDRPIYSENLVLDSFTRTKISNGDNHFSIKLNFCENIFTETLGDDGEIISIYPDKPRPGLINYYVGFCEAIFSDNS